MMRNKFHMNMIHTETSVRRSVTITTTTITL